MRPNEIFENHPFQSNERELNEPTSSRMMVNLVALLVSSTAAASFLGRTDIPFRPRRSYSYPASSTKDHVVVTVTQSLQHQRLMERARNPSIHHAHAGHDVSTTSAECMSSYRRSKDLLSVVQQLLSKYDCLDRLIALPLNIGESAKGGRYYWAEVHRNGVTELARIEQIIPQSALPSSKSSSSALDLVQQQPRLRVAILRDNKGSLANCSTISTSVVDLGQVTTVWNPCDENLLLNIRWMGIEQKAEAIPRTILERVFDRIHASTIRRGRKSDTAFLPKKQIKAEANALALAYNTTDNQRSSEILASHGEQVLRKVQKTGSGFMRLVDSNILLEELLHYGALKTKPSDCFEERRALASILLARDASEGGRFKRWPVVMLGHDSNSNTLSLLNGGWVVQDQSVRAGLEAQKAVARRGVDSNIASDNRILRRLECLAMGENMDGREGSDVDKNRLHLDVRQALSALQLPCTVEGARAALIHLGRWSDNLASVVQSWPANVLEAASQYARVDQERLHGIDKERKDLTNLPCICIDAKRTAFRDDALGIRPRRETGRWVDPDASKWEVLVHIADVSDIYSAHIEIPEDLTVKLSLLRAAAESRGTSRYDLPFGPLHLLPPVALEALGFSQKKSTQRCLTLWAYMDERNGKILDAGFERTLVATPNEMTYEFATSIMAHTSNAVVSKESLVLLALERVLLKWSGKRQERSEAARRREARFHSREAASRDDDTAMEYGCGNDAAVFRRTRAHRLVDAALDLYTYSGRKFLHRYKAPVPFARGGSPSEGGRVATAPLRRYIDGECQRQLLAVILGYGTPMSIDDCRRAARITNDARKQT